MFGVVHLGELLGLASSDGSVKLMNIISGKVSVIHDSMCCCVSSVCCSTCRLTFSVDMKIKCRMLFLLKMVLLLCLLQPVVTSLFGSRHFTFSICTFLSRDYY